MDLCKRIDDYIKVKNKEFRIFSENDPYGEEEWEINESENIFLDSNGERIYVGNKIKVTEKLRYYIEKYKWNSMMYNFIGKTFFIKRMVNGVSYITQHNYIPNDCLIKVDFQKVKRDDDPYDEENWEEEFLIEERKYKKLKNADVDPYGEEDWGWENFDENNIIGKYIIFKLEKGDYPADYYFGILSSPHSIAMGKGIYGFDTNLDLRKKITGYYFKISTLTEREIKRIQNDKIELRPYGVAWANFRDKKGRKISERFPYSKLDKESYFLDDTYFASFLNESYNEIREPIYRNFVENQELKHQLLDLDERKFGDIHKKYKWYVLNKSKREDYKNNLFTLVNLAYDRLGGHVRINSPDKVVSDDSLNFWIAVDNNSNPYADIVIFGRKTKYGIKLSGFGHDMNKNSKEELLNHLIKLLNIEGFFIEASGVLIHKLLNRNVPIIQDINIIKNVLNAQDALFKDTDHIFYTRFVGGNRNDEVLFRKPLLKEMNEGVRWYKDGKLVKDPDYKDDGDFEKKQDDFITDNEFRQFLIDNDAHKEYLSNCLLRRSYDKNLEKFQKEQRSCYISTFFDWSYSKEGDIYWRNLSRKWREFIRHMLF
jgi:hypothetical protein